MAFCSRRTIIDSYDKKNDSTNILSSHRRRGTKSRENAVYPPFVRPFGHMCACSGRQLRLPHARIRFEKKCSSQKQIKKFLSAPHFDVLSALQKGCSTRTNSTRPTLLVVATTAITDRLGESFTVVCSACPPHVYAHVCTRVRKHVSHEGKAASSSSMILLDSVMTHPSIATTLPL